MSYNHLFQTSQLTEAVGTPLLFIAPAGEEGGGLSSLKRALRAGGFC